MGRQDIRATLQENAGKRRHTLLIGPLGIGKSHILRHFATQLEQGGTGDKGTRGRGDSATEGRPHPVTPPPPLLVYLDHVSPIKPAQPLCPGPGCIGRLVLPNVLESDEIALQNLVPQAGLTNMAIFLYDQNGLLDILCETLNSQQLEYIDLTTWSYVQPGFKGSAVISATAWEHAVFDHAGQLKVNPVGLWPA